MPRRPRADRGGRRPHHHRDDLRHAERQGGAVPRSRRCSRSSASAARDDLGHHHRPVRPHPVRPDADRVLALDAATSSRFSIGLNCALGAREMRAHLAEMSRVADTLVCAYPNAGLPNEFGLYDESPEYMAGLVGEFAEAGLVNIVGGCCGTTPDHIRPSPRAVEGIAPRACPRSSPAAAVRARALRAHRGHPLRERRRAHQRHRVGPLPQAHQGGRLRRRARRRPRSGRERRADHRHQHGRGPARLRRRDGRLPQPRSPPSPTSPACR